MVWRRMPSKHTWAFLLGKAKWWSMRHKDELLDPWQRRFRDTVFLDTCWSDSPVQTQCCFFLYEQGFFNIKSGSLQKSDEDSAVFSRVEVVKVCKDRTYWLDQSIENAPCKSNPKLSQVSVYFQWKDLVGHTLKLATVGSVKIKSETTHQFN